MFKPTFCHSLASKRPFNPPTDTKSGYKIAMAEIKINETHAPFL
jgi:hypothetical protein